MIAHVEDAMRRQAQRMIDAKSFTKIGVVTGFDARRYAAKVLLKPDDVETGWLPIGSLLVGNGWGIVAPPSLGDQVEVNFLDGNLQAGVIGARFYSAKSAPMGGSKPGEFMLVHASGSRLRFLEDGTVELESAGNLDLNVGGDLTMSVDGELSIQAASAELQAATIIAGNLGVQGTIKATGNITGNTSVP